jgi:GT2 family glycosyltransferase/glycosyltransferase involved in cell wall biosynthesis
MNFPYGMLPRLKAELARLVSPLVEAGRLPAFLKAYIIRYSGLLDRVWYERITGSHVADEMAAAKRFVSSADDPGNAINPLFSADWYRFHYGFTGSAADALIHYLLIGERAGRQPNPWFDPVFFRKYNNHYGKWRTVLASYWRNWQRNPNPHPHFDGAWYVWQYKDVADGNINPLVHFLTDGLAQGRDPNAYFSGHWYRYTYGDILDSGENAAQHFCLFGITEMRSPGPNFDTRRYAAEYPDYAESGLDPFGHFMAIGRAQGRSVGTRYLHLWELTTRVQEDLPATGQSAPVVDVIVPVYKGLAETDTCLRSLLASKGRSSMRVHVYNDASPDPVVTEFLRQLARHEDIILVENPTNMGFVGTVNAAMHAAMASYDCQAVVLLNSDTEVANDWLDRLSAYAIGNPDVGTVTALSNNATICSYPKLGINTMPDDCTVAQLDRLTASVNAGMSVDIPTAVGFCMLITRDCLERVGYFDEQAFGRGYGEENDFCMRASALGYRHLLATDVFVKHVGEVSFAGDSAPGKENAGNIIRARYPDYDAQVARFCAEDPSRTARLRLTLARWRESGKPVTALITHDLGGGTERHVRTTSDRLSQMGHVVLIRPSVGHKSLLRIENFSSYDGFDVIVDAIDAAGFQGLLGLLGISAVQIHHLYDHGEMIREGLARTGLPFTFHMHDYYVTCPQITLTTAEQEYCGEPAAAGCDACIAQRPSLGASDIRNWREANAWTVLNATEVFVPSLDTAKRVRRYFDMTPKLEYHEPRPVIGEPLMRHEPISAVSPLRVVILGVMSLTKGRKKVFDTVLTSERLQLPMTFHLIGDSQGHFPLTTGDRFTITGEYVEDDLPALMEKSQADIFLFASAAPETYSFTLTSAMATGKPILATDLGAFAERLGGYQRAALYPNAISGEELAQRILAFARVVLPDCFASVHG